MTDMCYPDARWPRTSAGIEIEPLKGDGSDIVANGSAMVTVGTKMTQAAATLQALADSEDGQQGKAVDSLRESVGDSYTLLGAAGAMYTPIGQAIVDYGNEVVRLKPIIDARASTAEDRWQTFDGLPGSEDAGGRGYFLGMGPDEGSAEAEQHAEEDEAKRLAYESWLEAAAEFQGAYNEWEDAWDLATGEIEGTFTDELKDGFWEALSEFAEILGWVGLIVGVAALIIGGPILAAIAAVVGVIALAVTILQMFNGDKGWGDLALGVLGVLPFGKVGLLLGKGGFGSFVREIPIAKLGDAWEAGADIMAKGPMSYFRTNNPLGAFDVVSRLRTGMTVNGFDDLVTKYADEAFTGPFAVANLFSPTQLATFDAAHTLVGHYLKLGGYGQMTTGLPLNPKEQFPILDVFW